MSCTLSQNVPLVRPARSGIAPSPARCIPALADGRFRSTVCGALGIIANFVVQRSQGLDRVAPPSF